MIDGSILVLNTMERIEFFAKSVSSAVGVREGAKREEWKNVRAKCGEHFKKIEDRKSCFYLLL
jgi:hypothetical protein